MTVLDLTKLSSRLQIAKTNVDYAVAIHNGEEKEIAIKAQHEVDQLLNTDIESLDSVTVVQDYLESNEAKLTSLYESAIFISMESTAGQN